MTRIRACLLPLPALVALAGCASAFMDTGVTPKLLREPPYYAGQSVPSGLRIAHLPVAAGAVKVLQDGVNAAEGTPAAQLLVQLNAYLDSLSSTRPLAAHTPVRGRAPDVSFGCEADLSEDCEDVEEARRYMRLEVAGASSEWVQWLEGELGAAPADALLLITLELADYWPRARGWRADKEVALGTGYTQPLPWLTDLDRPVQVLQLTGAIVGADGKAIRIGAEGLLAKRTRLLLGAFGIREMVSNDDIAKLAAARREDVPGQPLVWQAALRNLVEQLTGPAPGTS